MMHINLEQAQRVVAAARRKATELSALVSVVVQDHSGLPVAFIRMDGTFLGAIDIAEKKARSSVYFRKESQDLWELCRAEGPAHGMELTNGALVTFAGGIPLYGNDGGLIGAIGVSGGTVEQDHAIAKAGRDAL